MIPVIANLNWDFLVPRSMRNWNWPPSDLRDLTDLWVVVTVAIGFALILWAFWRTVQVYLRTRQYLILAKRLRTSQDLIHQRAEWSNHTKLPLTSEFNDMLVEVPRIGNPLERDLKRCGSASEIFHSGSLAQGIVGSRLLMATPAILTGLGVLGTFVGLAMGIGALDLDSTNIEDLDKSISPLIKGSSTAFVTSVWGVVCSLIFTVFEKLLEWLAIGRIRKVTSAFNALVPRYTPEESMIGLLRSASEQEMIVKGLAVAIGEEMQKALDRIGNGITKAVEDALGGQAEDLGKKGAELMSKALTDELENLRKAVTGMSDGFKHEFVTASDGLKTTIGGFGEVLNGVTATVNSSQTAVTQAVERLTTHEEVVRGLENAAGRLKEAASELVSMRDTFTLTAEKNSVAASAQERAADKNELVAGKLETIAEKLPEVQAAVTSGSQVFASLGQPLLDLKDIVKSSQTAVTQAVERLSTHEEVVKGLDAAAIRLNEAATELSSMRDTFTLSAEKNSAAAIAQEKAANKNELVAGKLETIGDKLPGVQEALSSGAQVIASLGQPLLDLEKILKTTPELFGRQAEEQATRDEQRSGLLLQQTENLAATVASAAEKFAQIDALSKNLSASAENLWAASTELSGLAENISSASVKHAEAAAASEKAALAGERAAGKLEPIPQSLTDLSGTLDAASGKIKEGADAARMVYRELVTHQQQWFEGIKTGLEAMRDRVQAILQQYGDSVEGNTRNHMEMWTTAVDDSLSKFAAQVQTLEGAIQDLTDEMNH